MADLLSTAANIALILLNPGAAKISWDHVRIRTATLADTYGQTTALLVSIAFQNTADEYERIERVVLRGGDEEALAFRQSVTDECNMTAVAGAIIAQVAITALSLPNLSLAHWAARAFLLFAIVAGCLSVYYACKLQRTIGKLYQPALIRDWLRIPPVAKEGEDEKDDIKASLSALFVLSAPFTMMTYSIFTFLVGLTIYQGFTWTRTLDTSAGKNDSRNIFITFVISAGFCLIFFTEASMAKAIESLLLPSRLQSVSSKAVKEDPLRMEYKIEERQSSGFGRMEHIRRYASHSEASHWKQTSSTDNIEAVAHEALPLHKRQGVDELFAGGLAAALQAASDAHLQCAEMDRRVALEYAKLS